MARKNNITGFSALSDQEIFKTEDMYTASHYKRLNFCPRRWKGMWLEDERGKKVLDCLSCYSAANQGHHHSKIVAAMIKALEGSYAGAVSNVPYSGARALLSKKLATMQIGRAHV